MHSIKRNSSIELLRILSMLIIVIYHYEARNFNLYVVASDRVGEPDLLPQLLTHSIGKLGVPVFVFISGWYGLKYRKERFWEMVGMCIFYALISCIGCQLLYGQVRFLELPFSINLWWFMAAYLSVYLLSPGINHFIDTCDKWQVLLAVLTITYISFGDYFVKSANIGGLFQMFSMYLSARWIKLYLKKWIDKWWFLLLISLIIFRAGLIIGGHYTGHLGILPYLNSYVNPLTTLMSACIFIGCSKLSFNSTTINWLSASSLAVYLCSESPFGQMFFDSWFPHIEWNFLHFIIGAIAVYFCITIIDQIRKSITHNLIVNKLK